MPADRIVDPDFWRGKRVLLTGHTGFKGAWAALWLHEMGAHVTGLALPPDTSPNLHSLAGLDAFTPVDAIDLRNAALVQRRVAEAEPELVLHMAAQPLVRRSVREPVATFETNVMGTVHLLEALRQCRSLTAVLVVTTDKVYENAETGGAFNESNPLGGHDPYAASKAAAEIVVASYARTYFAHTGVAIATARGGNVIGGGDFSEDRIIPDIWRASQRGETVRLRYPHATRPWQHVLDCLNGYLAFLQALALRRTEVRALNFGPETTHPMTVAAVATAMHEALGLSASGVGFDDGPKPREMQVLALDTSLARSTLGWRDRLPAPAAIAATADWYRALARGVDMRARTRHELEEFLRQ